jgi:hypothetical protein
MATNGVITASATAHATGVEIFRINNTGTLNNLIKDAFSTGWIEGGVITDAGGGNIDIAIGEGFIRSSNSPTATLYYVDWNALTGQAVPSNTTRYIVVYYNAGSPVVQLLSAAPANGHEYIYLGEAHNIAGTLEIHNDPQPAGDAIKRLQDWSEGVIGTRVVSGEVVTDPSAPSRKLKITAGEYWDHHFLQYTDAAIDTSGAGVFRTYYRNGAGDWIRTASVTDWPNTQYDNGTGTLATMTAGYYSNLWVLRSFSGYFAVMYGQAEYTTLEDAYNEIPPTRPEELDEHGFLAAQITFQKSATAPDRIKDKRPIVGAEITGSSAADDGGNVLAAGTQTAQSVGTVMFSNSNGITFGMSNSSVITASHNGLTTAALSNHSHGNPTLNLTNLSGTTASNSAGFTLSLSAGAGGAGDGVNILAAGSQTANTTGTVLFNNGNGITFGMSNSSVITASHNGLTSQSNLAISAANGSFTFQTATFANSNGVSFSTGTQGIFASHNAITSQSAQTVGLYAVSNTTGQSSSSTFDARTLSFAGAGVASVGYSAGSVIISVPAGGGAAGSNTLGMSNLGNTAGTTGVVSGSALAVYFAGGANITISQSINASSATLTFIGPAAGAPPTQKVAGTPWITHGVMSNAFMSIQPVYIDGYMTLGAMRFLGSLSGNTNSSGASSYSFGLYTLNGSTMSLASSQSSFFQWTSGTNSTATTGTQFGVYSGVMLRGIDLTSWGMTPGNYMAAVWFRSTNNGSMTAGWIAQTATAFRANSFTSVSGPNHHLPMYYSASFASAMPASIAMSDSAYIRTSNAMRQLAMSMFHTAP